MTQQTTVCASAGGRVNGPRVSSYPYWINAFPAGGAGIVGGKDGNACQGGYLRRVEIMNSRTIGRLVVAAAVAAAIVVSDPGGAGNVAAPIAVAEGAVGAGSHAIVVGDPGGTVRGPRS
jgi:hypothetical protein